MKASIACLPLVCQCLLFSVAVGSASDFHLRIIHQDQGDIQPRYKTIDGWSNTCQKEDFQRVVKCHGGFARAVEYVKLMKRQPYTSNVLVVNTGDFFYGDMMHTVFKWQVSAEIAKHMPYDAIALGDKRFHRGLEELLPFIRSFPPNVFVCTNMDFSSFNSTERDELEKLCPRHRIITIGGKKVGIVSYLAPHAMELLKVPELRVEDEIEALTREVAVLKEKGVKLLVALGHSGYERDQEVARDVPSLDVIVGGHSHTLIWPDPFRHQATGVLTHPSDASRAPVPYPIVVVQPSGRRVLLLHAFSAGKYVGNINITFNAEDEVKDWSPQPKLLEESMTEDPVTKAVVDKFQQQLERKLDEVIGYSLVKLIGRAELCAQEECNMGNLMGDAILWALRSYAPDVPLQLPTIAFINAGLMRHNIPLGSVTRRMVTEVLPWRNQFEAIVVNGSTLLAALEHGASTIEQLHGRFMQVSGLSYHVDMSQPPYQRVSHVSVLCADCMGPHSQLLNASRHYHVALTNFIADGNDGYDMLKRPVQRQRFGLLDINMLLNYINQTSPVSSTVEGRVKISRTKETELQWPSAGVRSGWPTVGHYGLLLMAALLLVSAAVC